MKKISTIFVLIVMFSIIFTLLHSFADERITLTTYYPAPYGVYREMRVNGLAVGSGYRYNPANVTDGYLLVEGNVGIGTTNVGNRSEHLRVAKTGGAKIVLDDGNYNWFLELISGSTGQKVFAYSDLIFGSSAVERMRITSAGNVGIGTVSPTAAAAPNGQATENLDVNDVWLRGANAGAGGWASAVGASYPNCTWEGGGSNLPHANDNTWYEARCAAGCVVRGMRTKEGPAHWEYHQILCCCP